jgi:SAM-dependent methyltransferase
MRSEISTAIPRSSAHWRDVGISKHSFDRVYNTKWPHAYYREHRQFDYQIPQNAQVGINSLIEEMKKLRSIETVTLLDVGCSYGINGFLLKKQIELETLYRAYLEPDGDLRSHDIAVHARYYSGLKKRQQVRVVGLDPAEAAIQYALSVGALDYGVAQNLETEGATINPSDVPLSIDLIISTGCVGYVSEKTFGHILRMLDQPQSPWVLAYVMRPFSYGAIVRRLAAFGLLTVRLPQYQSQQRRFADPAERDALLSTMNDLYMDDSPERQTGYIHADCYLSVPASEADVLARLVSQAPPEHGTMVIAEG